MRILVFIPARKGSKGLKNKNFKKINGKPLIDHTIKFSKKLVKNKNNFSIFVSTDSAKYLKNSKIKGMKFDYLRPKRLSEDNSNIIDAIFHGVNWLERRKKLFFDTILLLQPTSPVRNTQEINKALKFFKKNKVNSLVSATQMTEHPYKCVKIEKNNWHYLEKVKKDIYRRQQYRNNKIDYCFIDGNFYIAKLSFLKKYKSFVKEGKTKIFKLRGVRPPDIDYISDFRINELVLNKQINLQK